MSGDKTKGDNFKRRRTKLGLIPRHLAAEEFCVATETVKKWELGERKIPRHAWRRLEELEMAQARKRK